MSTFDQLPPLPKPDDKDYELLYEASHLYKLAYKLAEISIPEVNSSETELWSDVVGNKYLSTWRPAQLEWLSFRRHDDGKARSAAWRALTESLASRVHWVFARVNAEVGDYTTISGRAMQPGWDVSRYVQMQHNKAREYNHLIQNEVLRCLRYAELAWLVAFSRATVKIALSPTSDGGLVEDPADANAQSAAALSDLNSAEERFHTIFNEMHGDPEGGTESLDKWRMTMKDDFVTRAGKGWVGYSNLLDAFSSTACFERHSLTAPLSCETTIDITGETQPSAA